MARTTDTRMATKMPRWMKSDNSPAENDNAESRIDDEDQGADKSEEEHRERQTRKKTKTRATTVAT